MGKQSLDSRGRPALSVGQLHGFVCRRLAPLLGPKAAINGEGLSPGLFQRFYSRTGRAPNVRPNRRDRRLRRISRHRRA